MPEKIEETPLRRISREFGDSGLFPTEVHRLYDAGKARKAQAALRAHVSKELNTGRRRRQQQYLDDVYLWLEPLGKAPTMSTINGIGTMLYGNYKPNPDGVHIATLWFVFVFLPVFPLVAYVVRKASGNSWTFYAKAPLPPFARLWRVGFAGLLVAVVVAIAASVAWDGSHGELWVYNGFDVPMEVTVDEDHFELSPRQVIRAGTYPLGALPVAATPQGWDAPLEQTEANLELMGDGELLYNIAGRASLVRSWVVYGPGSTRDDELLGTEPFVAVGNVDYLLREPPESKEVREGGSIVDELIYNAEDEVSLSVAAFFTQSMVGPEDAFRMLAARLAVYPGDHEALALATSMKIPGDPALVAIGERARAGMPDEVEAHRLYQNCLDSDGAAVARGEYTTLALEHADSAMYQYLAGRLLDDGAPEAETQFRKALDVDSDYAYAHLALGYQLATRGDLEQAIASYERYAAAGDAEFDTVLRSRIRLLQVRGEPGWVDQARAILDQADARFGADLNRGALRASMDVLHGGVALDQALGVLDASVAALVSDPTELGSALVPAQLDTHLAAGDVAGARALLAELDPEMDAWVLAKGELFLALGAADGDAVRQALDAHVDMISSTATSQALFAAAAAAALGHASADQLVELSMALERPGSVSPAVVLGSQADIRTPDAMDALLGAVPLDGRGLGYAAAAILLQHGEGDSAAVAHARAQAALLLLPDELPPWR